MSENKLTNGSKGGFTTPKLVLIAMMGAVSTVLMLIEFVVPFALPFIKMDFSEIVIILTGFIMGPIEGLIVILIKELMKLMLSGTYTMGVGELMNFCVSAVYMLSAVWIYRKNKTKKGAILALSASTVCVCSVAVLVNAFIIFPLYSNLLKLPMEELINMGKAVNPMVHDYATLMLCSVLPFNLMKYTIISIVTFLVYKRLASFIRNTVLK